MKSITLHQPWASLIVDERKKIETRAWRTHHRGLLAIHAAVRNYDEDFAKECGYKKRLPLGKILCLVELLRCTLMPTEPDEFSRWIRSITPEEQKYGNFAPGRYAWEFRVVRVFSAPIKAVGQQGMWNWKFEVPKDLRNDLFSK